MIKATSALSGVIAAVVMLGACTKSNEAPTHKPASVVMDAARPREIASAYVYEGGVCPVDSSSPAAVSNRIAASKKLPFTLSGWIAVDSTRRPVPPMVFAVLSGDSGAHFFEGKRTSRPDVAAAKGSKLFEQAGFEVVGSLLNIPAGDYRLSIVTGTEYVVNVCPTNLLVSVGD